MQAEKIKFINEKIYQVKLEFTNDEWLGLLNKEGEHLGVCCADVSRIRDILFSAIREDGWVKASDLGELVALLDGHHEVSQDNPLYKAKILWDEIKDQAEEPYVRSADPENLKDAFNIIYVASANLSWEWLTNNSDGTKSCEIYNFCSVLPAIRKIYEELVSFDKEFAGYVVCKDGQPIITNYSGWAFYETLEKAKHCFGGKFNIHKAKISIKDGLKIGEEVV